MLFNSLQFLGFLALVLGLYHALGRRWRAQNALLLVASYVFYGAWDWRFLGLIWLSTLIDFTAALRIEAAPRPSLRRAWLCVSLAGNLGMLGFFKYWDFFTSNMAELLGAMGFQPHLPLLQVVLPVGISFYTFQTISYTVDVYRRERPTARNLLDFALYVAFFPQLVAGPIERSTRLLPQLQAHRAVTRADWATGLAWMLQGYFLKVVVADSVAPLVDEAFARPGEVTGAVSALAVLGFALQIYGDFAGYTLIARGVSRLMGIGLMRNFHAPYLATGPRDFWRRWHISLSEWLRLYLYIPLGGSRGGRFKTVRNLAITMLLGGLWHGAAWTFILWGAFHGLLLIIAHLLKRPGGPPPPPSLRHAPRIAGMFALTLVGWLIFRAEDLANLQAIMANIAGNFQWDWMAAFYAQVIGTLFVIVMALDIWQLRDGDDRALVRSPLGLRVAVATFMLAAILGIGFRPQPFIYFQF